MKDLISFKKDKEGKDTDTGVRTGIKKDRAGQDFSVIKKNKQTCDPATVT